MSLIRYVERVRYRDVLGNVCLMVRLLAFVLLVPLGVSLLAGEFLYSLILGGLVLASFGLGIVGRRAGEFQIEGKEALIVVGLSYLAFFVFGAMVYLPAAGFWDGLFEAVSGFTTTGLSVLKVESLPRTAVFFRSYSQWIGGVGIVILGLIVFRLPGRDARSLLGPDFHTQSLLGTIRQTARKVLAVYLVLTGLGFLAFALAGMGWFDALVHILSTVSTGGFSSHSRSVGFFPGPAIPAVMIVFMTLGGIGFPAYYRLVRRGPGAFFRDAELLLLLGLGLGASVLFILVDVGSGRPALTGLFQSFSALTTTGFATVGYDRWPSLVKGLSVVLMCLGGSSFSTAGGFKLIRVVILAKLMGWFVAKRILPPTATVPITVEGTPVSEGDLKTVFSLLVFGLVILVLSSTAFMLAGFAPLDSVFECTSALGTVGLSSGITSSRLPAVLRLVLMFDMWAGRLEILSVLVILFPPVWAGRRVK
jgi:trk system potassium uptake protein TrkH